MGNPQAKVLCIGSMGKDIFFPTAKGDVIDADGKKKICFGYGDKVHVEDRFAALGGCACNVSTGLSRLGISSAALGNVGNDADGQWIIDMLKSDGVDVGQIHEISDAKTDISVIIVDASAGERTIFVNRDVGERLTLKDQDIQGYDWCFVGSLYGDAVQDNMRVLHDAVVRGEIKIAYNPGGRNIAHDEDVVVDLVHHAEIVFVNKSEARDIVAKFNLDTKDGEIDDEHFLSGKLQEHMKSDSSTVIVTDGRRGAWVRDGENVYHTDTIDKPVYDATGAGDAFASGFLAGVLHGRTAEESTQWGSANGDAVIDHYGAQKGLLLYDTIEGRLEDFEIK